MQTLGKGTGRTVQTHDGGIGRTTQTGGEDCLIFEGSILGFGVVPGQARSGVFREAFELFKGFLERDVNMIVICDILMYRYLRKTLQLYFPDRKIRVMYYVRWEQSLGGIKPLDNKVRHIIKTAAFAVAEAGLGIVNRLNGKMAAVREGKCFFSSQYAAPGFIRKWEMPVYICLQDAIPILFPENYLLMKDPHFWYNALIRHFGDGQNRYFAISESTKEDFCRLVPGAQAERIRVVYLGKDKAFRPAAQKERLVTRVYGLPEGADYFCSLCTTEPRKNLIREISTFLTYLQRCQVSGLYYVIGGGNWKEFYASLLEQFKDNALFHQYVKFIGYVKDEDLPELYSEAECFLFTSEYEGFGLPVLEAMACGCPVITSRSASLPEVAGDAALYVDWDSDEQHVEAYHRVHSDAAMRKRLSEAALARAALFSWDKCVDEMLQGMGIADGSPERQ